MLDFELAKLYEVENRSLKQAVKRNIDRFPKDFMFELTSEEIDLMVSQNVIPSKSSFGGAIPMAFTEQGVAMLSSVLKSKKALDVNIAIMRVFVFIRELALTHGDLTLKLQEIEKNFNKQFEEVSEAINYLLAKDNEPKKPDERIQIGFK